MAQLKTPNPSRLSAGRQYSAHSSSCGRCLAVDALAKRHGVELGIGGLLFVQIGGREPDHLCGSELVRPGEWGAVAANLVVVDRLCTGDDRRIKPGLAGYFPDHLICLLDNTIDRRALGAARLLVDFLKALV